MRMIQDGRKACSCWDQYDCNETWYVDSFVEKTLSEIRFFRMEHYSALIRSSYGERDMHVAQRSEVYE